MNSARYFYKETNLGVSQHRKGHSGNYNSSTGLVSKIKTLTDLINNKFKTTEIILSGNCSQSYKFQIRKNDTNFATANS